MASPEVESAAYWLSWINAARITGAFLVAIGVAAEFIGEYVARPLERTIEAAKDATMARLATDLASANARQKEAELSLEQMRKQVAPRLITQAQQNDLTAALAQFKGQRGTVIASPSTPESEWFARTLAAPLNAAGWDMQILPGTATATILFPKGVVVRFPLNEGKFNPVAQGIDAPGPADVLVKKLKEYGIDATASPWTLAAPNTIEIVISQR